MRPGEPSRPKLLRIGDGTFAAVIRAFVASPRFQDYAPATRELWGRELRLAERPDVLGALSVHEIRPSLVQAFLDGLATRPGKQRAARKALGALEGWAIVRDLLPRPITTGTEIVGEGGGRRPWTDAEVESAERAARADVAQAITLAANTGQRAGDLVKMRWSDLETVDGMPGINVVQEKTGLVLWIPCTRPLLAVVDQWERRPGFILWNAKGRPWSAGDLGDAWREERTRNAALAGHRERGLVLHGLRATAVIRLHQAGVSSRLIADTVGMSEQMVDRYCRFASQKENAIAAVLMLDRTARERARERKRESGS